ncbi:MAG: hypothetical protein HY294_04540 [Candidatus Rokubacteria bacterium]|nr:hypothetical protein [Candidatus Rokubacteria bacterium]
MSTPALEAPPLPPPDYRVPYPRWRAWGHALLDAARARLDRLRLAGAGAAIELGAIVHTEAIAHPDVFAPLVELLRFFREATGTPMVVCVIPAPNPMVRGLLAAHAMSAGAFDDRVRALAAEAVIGYHGHYFHPPAPDGRPRPMRHAGFDAARFRVQLCADLAWFAGLGIVPRLYTGGWWVLTRAIVEALDAAGIAGDFTLRPHGRNSFGEPYDLDLPALDGRPFPLAAGLWELGSCGSLWRYPADTSRWRAHRPAETGRRFVGLSFHDYDVLSYRGAFRRTIRALCGVPGARWAAFDAPDLPGAR